MERAYKRMGDRGRKPALPRGLLQKSVEKPDGGLWESGPGGLLQMGEMRACSQGDDNGHEIM